MTVELSTLEGVAADVAAEISRAFPDATFTSARRTIVDQGRVMAENMSRNRKWIEQTYMRGRASIECQEWADRHQGASLSDMATAFATIIAALSESDRRRLSRHLTGEAFDVRPMTGKRGEELKDALTDWAFKKGGRFLTREGGLDVWHWQAP